jgi:hypothetical protein
MADPPNYQFLPWMRGGLATELSARDTLGAGLPARARVDVNVRVEHEAGGAVGVKRSIELSGPGDVVGIDRRQIIRTDPKANATDFEPNYLAQVEFDKPELVWLFTPAAANKDKLRPWLVLVVVTPGDGVSLQQARPLPVLTLSSDAASRQLPDLADSWAWAHGQVLVVGDEQLDDLLAEHPERTASRLLCPRRLDPNTGYLACVVPAFEAGRRAGLGEEPAEGGEEMAPAWTAGAEKPVVLPVYFSWTFATGKGGDFESLASALRTRPIPAMVGRHELFVGAAGPPLPARKLGKDGAVVLLQGALVPPEKRPPPWPQATRAAVTRALRDLLDLPARRLGTGSSPTTGPAVTAPLYARWLAAHPTVPAAAAGPLWFRTLNLDPRHRAIAALGTRVVQAEQQRLVAEAWAQLGALEQANEELRWAQLAVQVRSSLLRHHLAPLPAGRILEITSPAHKRMLIGAATVAARARASALPEQTLTTAFRRTVRPRGPLARRTYDPAARTMRRFVEGLDRGSLEPAPPARPPDGLFGFATPAPARSGVEPEVLSQIAAAAGSAASRPPRVASASAVRAVAITDSIARSIAARLVVTVPSIPVPTDPVPATTLAAVLPVPTLPEARQLATAFREITALTIEHISAVAGQPPEQARPPLGVGRLRAQVIARLNPAATVRARVFQRLVIPKPLRPIRAKDPLQELLARPVFPQPTWELLRDQFPEHLLPGLEHVSPNTVSLMQTNPRFVEAFLVGLNHELGRELLWREYPFDQRSTAFRRFWAAAGRDDIDPIEKWNRTADLGETFTGGREQLVLLVRGDLLRRYPSTVIYAAPDAGGKPELADAKVKQPLFRGSLDPDVTFVGFDLTPEQARTSWWFIFEQQPTEPRFALDIVQGFGPDAPPLIDWNKLSWSHLAANEAELAELTHIPIAGFKPQQPADAPRWGASAAAMAAILVQQPVRVLMRGADLLRPRPD